MPDVTILTLSDIVGFWAGAFVLGLVIGLAGGLLRLIFDGLCDIIKL